MSTQALSRLLEAVAKSIRHATAMSTILATEILQARRDAVLDSSKVLLENSCHALRKSPINAKTLFANRIKEVAKTNFEAQQQKFLATSSAASTIQQPSKPSRPQQSSSFRPKGQTKSYPPNRKDYSKRGGNQKQFPSSKQASSSTKFLSPTLSTASLATPRYSSGRKVGPFCGTMGRTDKQRMGPLYRPKRVQDPI